MSLAQSFQRKWLIFMYNRVTILGLYEGMWEVKHTVVIFCLFLQKCLKQFADDVPRRSSCCTTYFPLSSSQKCCSLDSHRYMSTVPFNGSNLPKSCTFHARRSESILQLEALIHANLQQSFIPGTFRAGHWSECISTLDLGYREEITTLEGAAPASRILMLKGCGTKLVAILAFILLPLETGKKAIGQCRHLLESSVCFCRARRTHSPGFLCNKKG